MHRVLVLIFVAAISSTSALLSPSAAATASRTLWASNSDNRYCALQNVVVGHATDGPANLPENCINSALANTPSHGTVVRLAAGGNLQAAYDALVCGETLSIARDGTWVGPFNFTPKNCDAQHWITIRANGALSPAGVRIAASYLPQMAKIYLKPGAIANSVTGDHIRFIGIAWLKQPGNPLVNFVTMAGSHDIVFDRNYAHGNPGEETRRFVDLSGGNSIAIVESWIDEMHCIAVTGSCTDAQAISGGSGSIPSGTYKIVNNYLSASTENILFGGSPASVTPCDIEVRNNYFYKPMSWMPTSPDHVAPTYVVKNLFELKNACRVLLEGNIMANTWGGFSQAGYALLIGPKNQAAGTGNVCPLCFISDVTVRYNYITTASGAFVIANGPSDNHGWANGGHNYSIHDDVFDNLQYAGCYGCGQNTGQVGSDYQATNPPPAANILHDVAIDHVTLITAPTWPASGSMTATAMLNMSGPPAVNPTSTPQIANVSYINSIFASGWTGFYPTGGGVDNCSVPGPSVKDTLADMIAGCWTGSSWFSGNVVVGYAGTSNWPAANSLSPSWSAVDFTNYNNGSGGDYHLSASSPYKGAALDGTDPGADIDLVLQYTQTAITGID